METFSALLVPGEFPTHRPVTRSFDVFYDLCLNKQLSKQSWGPPSESAHCHGIVAPHKIETPCASNTNWFHTHMHSQTRHVLLKITMVATKTCFTVVDLFKPSYTKTHYKCPVMPKMARNRSALLDVLAQGASNRDITVLAIYLSPACFFYLYMTNVRIWGLFVYRRRGCVNSGGSINGWGRSPLGNATPWKKVVPWIST